MSSIFFAGSAGTVLLVGKTDADRAALRDHASVAIGSKTLSECSAASEVAARFAAGPIDLVIIAPECEDAVVADVVQICRSRKPGAEVLMVFKECSATVLREDFFRGVAGMIVSHNVEAYFQAAVQACLARKPYLCPEVQAVLLPELMNGMQGRHLARSASGELLTIRERQITQLVAHGMTSKQIGGELGPSFKTIEAHRASIMKKLAVSSAAELIKVAHSQKLIEPRL